MAAHRRGPARCRCQPAGGPVRRLRDRLRKVTTADVQRVADSYLKPANRVLGMFVPDATPNRAEIPPPPDLAAALEAYRSTESMARRR